MYGIRRGGSLSIAGLAIALAAFVGASAADAAALKSEVRSETPHGRSLEITYQAYTSEQNQLVVAYPQVPVCLPAGPCVSDELEFVDPGASITVRRSAAEHCVAAGSIARCGIAPPRLWLSQVFVLFVDLGPLADSLRVVGPPPVLGDSWTIVHGGTGNDTINTRNQDDYDVVSCGLGRDSAKVDARDRVDTTCETVIRP